MAQVSATVTARMRDRARAVQTMDGAAALRDQAAMVVADSGAPFDAAADADAAIDIIEARFPELGEVDFGASYDAARPRNGRGQNERERRAAERTREAIAAPDRRVSETSGDAGPGAALVVAVLVLWAIGMIFFGGTGF